MWALTKVAEEEINLEFSIKRNVCTPIPTGVGVLDVQSVTGWRDPFENSCSLSSLVSFLPIDHNSFFFSNSVQASEIMTDTSEAQSRGYGGCESARVMLCPPVCLPECWLSLHLCFVAGPEQNSSAGRMCCWYWRNLPVWLQRVSHQCTDEGERD